MFGNKPKTLDGIMSSFTKIVEELRLLQDNNSEKAMAKVTAAADLYHEANLLKAESERAAKIEQNINSLLA
jgi:hypothetical protein